MVSTDYIIINGVSSDTVDLYIDTPPAPPFAEERTSTFQTGYDEDMTIREDTFKDCTITIKAYTFLTSDFDNSAIYAYLQNARTLQISRFSTKYYKVRALKSITPAVKADGKRIDYTISFVVAPFKYSVSNDAVTIASSGSSIEVAGSRYARPVWHVITQSTGFALFVNGTTNPFTTGTTTLTPGTEYIIDCERMIFYTGSTIIYGTLGNYPFLAVGTNVITWEGNISVSVVKNERWR